MDTLKGTQIILRALEPEDLSFLYQLENNEAIWEVSHTQTPYSSYILKEYIVNAHKDIYEVKQLRLAIEDKAGKVLGLIDLFDFDPKNKRAGVGIVIANKEDRNKGLGKEALQLIIKYSFAHLNLHQLYCNITEDNQGSIALFESLGFTRIGLKKDWNFHEGVFKNEIAYQLIK